MVWSDHFLDILSRPDTSYASAPPERLLHSLADYFKPSYPRLPIPLYTHALTLSPPPARRAWYIRQLRTLLSSLTEPPPPYTTEERRIITDFTRAYPQLWDVFSSCSYETLASLDITICPQPAERGQQLWVQTERREEWERLPRLFSWLVPGKVAFSSTPRGRVDIESFGRLGVTLVVTLTVEEPLPDSWFKRTGVRNEFVPARNYYPPTVSQMDRILRMIHDESAAGGRTLVHCGGGKGRAGTVAACYLALYGPSSEVPGETPQMGAQDAVEKVRMLRPGSVETSQQEEFIKSYISLAWKRYGYGERLCSAPLPEPSGPLELNGDTNNPDVFLLTGLPGSGKSSFTRLISIRRKTTVVSGDDIVAEGTGAGVRAACEGMIGRWRRSPECVEGEERKVLVIDRCNPTANERKTLVKLLLGNPRVFGVHFGTPPELCIQRGEARAGHPTLPPWRVRTAVESNIKQLTPPSMDEGIFTGVAVVHSIDNARELADKLFGEVPLLKFPRTHHLLNLGSATRDDLILPSNTLEHLIATRTLVVVEEKIDGANLGFSLSSSHSLLVQNRSRYVTAASHAQFTRLPEWLTEKGGSVYEILMNHGDQATPERFVLYGEWMAAQHSVPYTSLPDWFIAFDMFDRLHRRFLTRSELEGVLDGTGIELVPKVFEGVLNEGKEEGEEGSEEMILGMLEEKSEYSSERREGVVVKWGGAVRERGKVVRGDFIAGDEHWSRGGVRKNKLREHPGE